MKSMLAGLGLALIAGDPVLADHVDCSRAACPFDVALVSFAAERSYGLLLQAPASGCRRVRYRVETPGHDLLGKTAALRAGEIAVVRLGPGFAKGTHRLVVRAEGCGQAPVHARRVTLRKLAPDHGWRAGLVNAALLEPGH